MSCDSFVFKCDVWGSASQAEAAYVPDLDVVPVATAAGAAR